MADRDVNIVQVTGTVSSEPEMRYTNDGIEQTTMLLTSQRTVRRAEGMRTETEQFLIVTQNKLALLCAEQLKLGSKAFFEGSYITMELEGERQRVVLVKELIIIQR